MLRRTAWLSVILAILIAAWWLSPVYDLHRLRLALETGDPVAIDLRIAWADVIADLRRQGAEAARTQTGTPRRRAESLTRLPLDQASGKRLIDLGRRLPAADGSIPRPGSPAGAPALAALIPQGWKSVAPTHFHRFTWFWRLPGSPPEAELEVALRFDPDRPGWRIHGLTTPPAFWLWLDMAPEAAAFRALLPAAPPTTEELLEEQRRLLYPQILGVPAGTPTPAPTQLIAPPAGGPLTAPPITPPLQPAPARSIGGGPITPVPLAGPSP